MRLQGYFCRSGRTKQKQALRRELSRSGGFVLSVILLTLPFSWCHEDVCE
nr:MAG TPA: hypothetical protein [Caudoviricetes sp.]